MTRNVQATGSSPSQIRANAAYAVRQVIFRNRTIDWVDEAHPQWLVSGDSRRLTFGTLRHYFSISAALDELLAKPLRSKDADLHALLLVGIYQLAYTDTPDHAAINETVQACVEMRKPWARGLLNGILRAYTRGDPDKNDRLVFSDSDQHNPFLQQELIRDFGPTSEALFKANNTQAPMCLRINTMRVDPQAYREKLRAAEIEFNETYHPENIVLRTPQPAATLPGWESGLVAVQDSGAQFAAHLLLGQIESTTDSPAQPPQSLRVLDACSAPGGKYFHMREQIAARNLRCEVTVLEREPKRLAALQQIGQRLQHVSRESGQNPDSFIIGDATTLDWWDGSPFALILLDAPCSGTGTIRHHPEIKIQLTQAVVTEHQALQLQILTRLWHVLAQGGTLLYCTCSVLSAENDTVIDRFLDQVSSGTNDNANVNEMPLVLPITLPTGAPTRHGWQLLPTEPDTDGFYYALIGKRHK